MCQGRWSEIAYKAVPALCMKIHAEQFAKHDEQRFLRHLEKLASGAVQANIGALQPHEILLSAVPTSGGRSQTVDQIGAVLAQAQWEALVSKVRGDGTLDGCIAVCDVSGSMGCEAVPKVTCMDVAVAMSLLLAEVAEGPHSRKLITFHEQPSLISLPQTKQLAKLNTHVRSMPWGGSTSFYRVFELLMQMEPPPKRVFVFSDMQFDQACRDTTDLQHAKKLYSEADVPMPQLVFWNLRSHAGAPALAEDMDVALMSGFSSVMMQLLEEGVPQQEETPDDSEKRDEVVDTPEAQGDTMAAPETEGNVCGTSEAHGEATDSEDSSSSAELSESRHEIATQCDVVATAKGQGDVMDQVTAEAMGIGNSRTKGDADSADEGESDTTSGMTESWLESCRKERITCWADLEDDTLALEDGFGKETMEVDMPLVPRRFPIIPYTSGPHVHKGRVVGHIVRLSSSCVLLGQISIHN